MLLYHKVEVLQAEVSALKHLVLTSTSSPGHSGRLAWRRHSTEHLSPCPDCNSYDCDAAVARYDGTCLHAKNSLSDESEVGPDSTISVLLAYLFLYTKQKRMDSAIHHINYYPVDND